MLNVPFYLLCVFAFFMPWETLGGLKELPTVARLLGALTLVVGLLAIVASMKIRRMPFAFVVMIVFAFLCLLSISWATDSEKALAGTPTILLLLLFVWLIWEFAPTVEDQLWLMRSFIYGHSVPIVMQFTSFRAMGASLGDDQTRYSGGGHDANYYSELLSMAALFCAYIILHTRQTKGKIPLRYLAFIPIIGIAIMLTGSRTGFVALLCAGACILFVLRFGGWKIIAGFVVVAGALVFLIPRFTPAGLMTRVTEGTGFSVEKLGARAQIWEGAITAFWERPILGQGINCASEAIGQASGHYNVAHNLFLSILVELGIVGLAIYLLLLFFLLLAILSMPKAQKWFWLSVMLVWGLFAMSCGAQFDKLSWFLFAMILAQAAAFRNRALAAGAAVGRALPATNRLAPRFPPVPS